MIKSYPKIYITLIFPVLVKKVEDSLIVKMHYFEIYILQLWIRNIYSIPLCLISEEYDFGILNVQKITSQVSVKHEAIIWWNISWTLNIRKKSSKLIEFYKEISLLAVKYRF